MALVRESLVGQHKEVLALAIGTSLHEINSKNAARLRAERCRSKHFQASGANVQCSHVLQCCAGRLCVTPYMTEADQAKDEEDADTTKETTQVL